MVAMTERAMHVPKVFSRCVRMGMSMVCNHWLTFLLFRVHFYYGRHIGTRSRSISKVFAKTVPPSRLDCMNSDDTLEHLG